MSEQQVSGKFVFWLGLVGDYETMANDPKSGEHTGKTFSGYGSYLVKCTWNTSTDEVKLDGNKALMFKNEFITSCCEYGPDCLVVSFLKNKALYKVSKGLAKIEEIDMSQCDFNENKNFIAPMPQFDDTEFPFLLCTGKA